MRSPSFSYGRRRRNQTLSDFITFITLALSAALSAASQPIYSAHCDSVVPEPEEVSPSTSHHHRRLILRPETSYFTGGAKVFGPQLPFKKTSLSFDAAAAAAATKGGGVSVVEGRLVLRSYAVTSGESPRYVVLDSLNLDLKGFWSVSSGKLCMVGSGSWFTRNSSYLDIRAVFKLDSFYSSNLNISTSFVNGLLENLAVNTEEDDSSYFEPISILAFPPTTSYNPTLITNSTDDFSFSDGGRNEINIPMISEPSSGLSLEPGVICDMFSTAESTMTYKLRYPSKCSSSSRKNCTPFGEGGMGYLPPFLSLYAIDCSKDENVVRFLVRFQNDSQVAYQESFDPNNALVGEGTWNRKNNRLLIAACRVLDPNQDPGGTLINAKVGDCTTRLSLWFPGVWSIKKRASVEGHIWSTKAANEPGYFDRIEFESFDDSVIDAPGWRYEYTEIDRVRESCLAKKPVQHKAYDRYDQDRDSYYLQFEMAMRYASELCGWGDALPVSINDRIYKSSSKSQLRNQRVGFGSSAMWNISYKLSFPRLLGVKPGGESFPWKFPSSPEGGLEIFAEGVYDEGTGQLCMVGCRNLGLDAQELTGVSTDCEILVTFRFLPREDTKGVYTEGVIESTRDKDDPLYFQQFSVSSNAICNRLEAKMSIQRKDIESIMVIISDILACVFVATQLFYTLNHPDMVPYTSVFMLLMFVLGYLISLGLIIRINIKAYTKFKNIRLLLMGSTLWPKAKDVFLRVVNTVTALLECYLVRLVWMARSVDRSKKGFWVSERKALFASLPVYTLGGMVALFLSWKKNIYSSKIFSSLEGTLFRDTRNCGGWILDGFLVPQILLNMFQASQGSVLSPWFYVGTTLVRILPRVYDIYRNHHYEHMDELYIYADPGTEFYSDAWDVILPFLGVLFALIIYLQQRFGGRCIFPESLREVKVHEKAPLVSDEETYIE